MAQDLPQRLANPRYRELNELDRQARAKARELVEAIAAGTSTTAILADIAAIEAAKVTASSITEEVTCYICGATIDVSDFTGGTERWGYLSIRGIRAAIGGGDDAIAPYDYDEIICETDVQASLARADTFIPTSVPSGEEPEDYTGKLPPTP